MDELFPDEEPKGRDELLTSLEADVAEPVSLSFATKFAFWIFVWGGTTGAGVALALLIGVFVALAVGDPLVLGWALLIGLLWSGGVAAFLMIHVATFKWMFGIDCSPKFIAGIAGGLTGLSLWCLCVFSVPLGIAGAVTGVNVFLKTSLGEELLRYEAWRLDPTTERSKKSFTLKDLMLRMTAISVLLAFWTFLLSQR